MATVQIQESSKSLSESIQEFSRNIMLLSDLYSDCGFDEFNDLLQAISSLSTGYQHQISEQSKSIQENLDQVLRYHHKEADSFKELHKHL